MKPDDAAAAPGTTTLQVAGRNYKIPTHFGRMVSELDELKVKINALDVFLHKHARGEAPAELSGDEILDMTRQLDAMRAYYDALSSRILRQWVAK